MHGSLTKFAPLMRDPDPAGARRAAQQLYDEMGTRTDAQNRLMWPLIADIRAQVPEHAQYTPDQTKLRFLDALGAEMVYLPKIAGAGLFPVGQRSSTLTKAQFTLLIELIFAEGERCGVRWSKKALDSRDEVMAA